MSGRRRSPVVRVARVVPFLLLLALAAPVTAQAVWSGAVTLSAPGQDGIYPQVAVDEGGNTVFVWQRYDATTDCGGSGCSRIQARVRSPAGTLTSVQTLSAAGQHAYGPDVAGDQNGNAVFSWTRLDGTTDCQNAHGNPSACGRIQTRTRFAGGTLGAVQTLSALGQDAGAIWQPETATAPVAIDQSGNAVFAWLLDDETTSNCCSRVQARIRSAGGALRAIQTLSAAGSDAYFPQVDVDQSGNAVFAWTLRASCAYACARFEARARSAAGVLSATQTLSESATPSNRVCDAVCLPVDLAVDQNGNAIFVWERLDETSQYCCFRAQTRARSSAGTLTATQTLSLAGEQEWLPRVAVDLEGNAVFAWQGYDGTTGCGGYGCPRVQARTRSAAGAVDAIEYISAPERLPVSRPADIAIDEDGNSVFVWEAWDGTTDCGGTHCLRVKARSRSAAGVLSDIHTLARPGQHAYSPHVAVNPSGNAGAVWQRFDGTNDRVQGAVGP